MIQEFCAATESEGCGNLQTRHRGFTADKDVGSTQQKSDRAWVRGGRVVAVWYEGRYHVKYCKGEEQR